MSTIEENYKRFMNFANGLSISTLANKLKVSEKTVSRYKNKNTEIPEYILLIIELYEKQTMNIKKIHYLEFELLSIKQSIENFKESQKQLLNI